MLFLSNLYFAPNFAGTDSSSSNTSQSWVVLDECHTKIAPKSDNEDNISQSPNVQSKLHTVFVNHPLFPFLFCVIHTDACMTVMSTPVSTANQKCKSLWKKPR